MHPDLFADGSTRGASVDEVLDAALDVFAKVGIRRATVDEIANQAGLGRVTVYRRVGGKSEIVNAVLMRESQKLFTAVRDAAARADDFADRVVRAFATTIDTVRSNAVWNRLLEIEPDTVLRQLTIEASPLLAGAVAATAEVLRGSDMAELSDRDLLARAEILVRITHSILLTPDVLSPLHSYDEIEGFARQHLLPIAATAGVDGEPLGA
ncbi:TetR/AcrR family transcriptional regulator [Mycolicibacterium brumae]|uniref:TetR/AcrR family transcriptional regulator n=1 Tax=Mycolicibacterium brumae TaxID=85968 RepID=A0A2G5P448_9MYCO|nr:TetR/AcrR family transcriptional regulator [Mycolicibacterium brumae]MCV7194163.1 TetR/AcrR family transcriptional regulator [Mycolicibacterium brumae]PIB73189.1 TetR/AcrR family transcriptional regulator [Mycolicibacterium brumae]UWW07531.1 TetR/AcrR family transcriptional regulator [Mycolicibacterium brumae]